MDARWRFNGRYEVSGSLDLSRVAGDTAAIARTQRDPVHLYQRPDGPLTFDSHPHLAERRPTRRSGSPRWAAGGSTSRPPTSGARPASRSTTSASCARPTSRSGPAGPTWPSTSPTRSSSSSAGTSTTGNTGPARGCRPSGPSTPTSTSSSPTAGGSTWAAPSASSAPPIATAARAAGRPCDRTRTSRPGSRSRATTGGRWCRSCRSTTVAADQGRSESDRVTPELDLKVSSRFTTSLSAGLQPQPERPAVLRHVHRPGRRRPLHLRPPRPEDAQRSPGGWATPSRPRRRSRCTRRPFVSKGTLQRRARGRRGPGGRRTTPATGPTVTPRRARRPAASTSSSSARTWCSGGSIGRDRRCFWCGARGGKDRILIEGAQSFRGDLGDLFARRADDTFLVKVSYWLTR